MKIVQINCSSFGSTGNIAHYIHKKLLENGDDSYIFYGVGKSKDKKMMRVGGWMSLHLHAFLSKNFGKQGYYSYFSTKRMIEKIKKINPDIVHLHNLHGSYLNLKLLFSFLKKSKVNVIITLHDCWLFTGKCPHFTLANCYKWKEECGECKQLSIYPKSKKDTTKKSLKDKKEWLNGFGEKLKIITVSNWLKNVAKQSFLSQYSIETIYNGVDTDVFYPMDDSIIRKKYNLENKFIILGVSSNWNDQKGLNEFMDLSNELNDNEIIVLVGLNEKQIKEMPKNIIGIQHTDSQKELAELYSAANVFLNLSKEETFGLVTAEAMACGTPVIVYNSTACSEIVNEKSGKIIENEKEIREIINEKDFLIRNESSIYAIDNMGKEYMKLYENCCKK